MLLMRLLFMEIRVLATFQRKQMNTNDRSLVVSLNLFIARKKLMSYATDVAANDSAHEYRDSSVYYCQDKTREYSLVTYVNLTVMT